MLKRLAVLLAALAPLGMPALASAHYPDASYSSARVKEWQREKHISCSWFSQIGGGCRNQQVVYNQITGEHSRLIGVYIQYNNGSGGWISHYDCVRRDHDGDLSFWGHYPCYGI